MNIDLLIKMANEISAFFASDPDKEQAARDCASHIRRFWEPRMRQQIIAHYQRGAAGLTDIARNAIGILATEASAKAAG